MPIREYVCEKCGNIFENVEIEVKTGSVVCPDCGSTKVQSLLSIFSSGGRTGASCGTGRRFT